MSKKAIILSIVGFIVLVGGGIAVAAVMGKGKGKGKDKPGGSAPPPTEPFFARTEEEAKIMQEFAKKGKYAVTDGSAREAVRAGLYVPLDANTQGQNDAGILHWMAGIAFDRFTPSWGKDLVKIQGMKSVAEQAAFQRQQQVLKQGGVLNFTF